MRPPARPRVTPPPPPRVAAPTPAPGAAPARPRATPTATARTSGARTEPAAPVVADTAPAGSGRELASWRTPRQWSPRRAPVVSTGSAARFAERTAARRRVLRDRVLLIGSACVVVVALAWVLLASPVLALHADEITVAVEGTGTTVDPDAVLAVVQDSVGTPLPRLDTVAVRRAILDVPGVRAATVTRSWPHGVGISVVARDPVAAVPTDEGDLVLVDQDGVQVGRTDVVPEGLPEISVPLDGDTRAMTAVLVVLQQLPAELAAQVADVAASNRDAVTLTLRDGAVVEWGSADDSALKATVLATLRAAPSSAGVKVYDVSAPTLPITRS